MNGLFRLFFYSLDAPENNALYWKVCKKPVYWKTKTSLSFLISARDFSTKAFIKLYSCRWWHFCISEVGIVVKVMSKEAMFSQDGWVSTNFTCYYMYLWELSQSFDFDFMLSVWRMLRGPDQERGLWQQCRSVTIHYCRTRKARWDAEWEGACLDKTSYASFQG